MPGIQISPCGAQDEVAIVERLARAGYDAAHPSDSFEALKVRRRFSKEAAGLYREWMRAARAGVLDAATTADSAGQEASSYAAAA